MIREHKALIKQKQNFQVNEVENNKDYKNKIAALERQENRLQQQVQEEESKHTQLKNEVTTPELNTLAARLWWGFDVNALLFHR